MSDQETCQHDEPVQQCATCWPIAAYRRRPMPPWVRDLYRTLRDQHQETKP